MISSTEAQRNIMDSLAGIDIQLNELKMQGDAERPTELDEEAAE